mmetsp:Transcript_13654/g.49673  ORF Transcript_13654/g.49673 Transcript_13654/m.49673 type:complete len:2207 (-) Transcript_13654:489-7109(-)
MGPTRLSLFLKAHVEDTPLDLDKEYLLRRGVLATGNMGPANRATPPLEKHESKQKTDGLLSSALLDGRSGGGWTKAPRRLKELHDQFLRQVSSLLGDDLPSSELQAAALEVYQVLRFTELRDDFGSKKQLEAVRQQLGKALHMTGALRTSDANLRKTWELARSMHSFNVDEQSGRTDATAAPNPKASLAKVVSSNRSATATAEMHPDEFGFSLAFVAPQWCLPLEQAKLEYSATKAVETERWSHEPAVGASESSTRTYTPAVSEMPSALEDDGLARDELRLMYWVREQCEVGLLTSGGSGMDVDDLAFFVCQVLLNDDYDDSRAAEQLYGFFGDSGFEIIGSLVGKRILIVKALCSALRNIHGHNGREGSQRTGNTYGQQVHVLRTSDKLLHKMQRKEDRKNARRLNAAGNASGGDNLELLASVNSFVALLQALAPTAQDHHRQAQKVHIEGMGTGDSVGRMLPKGTEREHFRKYEEVRIPAAAPSQPRHDEELVPISRMENFAQLAFKGYKSLNRIQSRIYETGYYSNENLLVCAPTGAGKTNIAMLTILHEVRNNISDGVLNKEEFKIVYVAPMKALAAEMAAAFGKRLAPLGLSVRELTGDMQLTKTELMQTQMIVTTPEKWDVITRKSSDNSFGALVKLLIIDEVHLLNDDRGAVIETIVARTLRQVEATQTMIRIVGLSATLPTYKDVASFLRVNLETGLFYFDSSYRPIPLSQQFIGVNEPNILQRKKTMTDITYEKLIGALAKGKQVMVFVHSRKDTVNTARSLMEKAQQEGDIERLEPDKHTEEWVRFHKELQKSRNKEVVELAQNGFGCHNAGMLRPDRTLVEKLFSAGIIKCLVCTATLAWGVNLPAHTVIIKGTEIYDPQKGSFIDLSMLDVMQIFGRAGRPQFDTSGTGIIITTHNKLPHYLQLLTAQLPIESQMISSLRDTLNAEVVLGTVTNVKEAMQWLGYTYLFVRMTKNPLVYGIGWEDVQKDPQLVEKRRELITSAAKALDRSKMIRFDERSGTLYQTEQGRIASHYYIRHASMDVYAELLKPHMSMPDLLNMVAHSSEFENVVVREEEMPELMELQRSVCPHMVKGGIENKQGKVNVLIQCTVSRAWFDSFSLAADANYVGQNIGRICRALFELHIRKGQCSLADSLLQLCISVERRVWPHQNPLRQFENVLSSELLLKLEEHTTTMEKLWDLEPRELGAIVRHPNRGKEVRQCLDAFPGVNLSANIQPITRSVLRVQLFIEPIFVWRERSHGNSMRWHIWVEDQTNEHIYHSEVFTLTKKMTSETSVHQVAFTIPVFEPLPPQYYIRAISDEWLGAEAMTELSFKDLILPDAYPPHTELLDLRPLPKSALQEPSFEALYKFTHFNPIQSQIFHTLYHTDKNVLLGAPTGSGKTISSELGMLRVFRVYPDRKVIYIAPLKALVRERIDDWRNGLCKKLDKKLVELTGDYTPDLKALLAADIIVCTPEKWDGISRNWKNRGYVKKVGLIVIDEIHLLGQDRGPILEVIVSRMRYIASQTSQAVRFVGLSTALANARDLGDWLGIDNEGLFNFKPSVRPVPMEVHIQGYPGKFYCPRMATMNKPAYAAIRTHSPLKPVLIFVSSRRQTRLTALDIIAHAVADEQPQQFVSDEGNELAASLARVKDSNLKHTLQFGIGMHHAGLQEDDRKIVEHLFVTNKIQVLVCTSTLAWGVNFPAHLVIIKGTEYYDGATRRYVDFPITDVLQMMGRAGRPQFDKVGKAVIMVHEPKKSFYKKFLYEPFPVESSLADNLYDHINAEIGSGTIKCKQDAVDYLTWTYLYCRLMKNPTYYNLEGTSFHDVSVFLSSLVESTLDTLESCGCCIVDDDGGVDATTSGRIASFYYLKHTTIATFKDNLRSDSSVQELLDILCSASEFDELPVRHNEDKLNAALAESVYLPVDVRTADDPHTKANLLFQAHLSRLPLPVSDYFTDTKSVLDNSVRIIQAMVDAAADAGWLSTTMSIMHMLQMFVQAAWGHESSLLTLPHVYPNVVEEFNRVGIYHVPQLVELILDSSPKASQRKREVLTTMREAIGNPRKCDELLNVCRRLPVISVETSASKVDREPRVRNDRTVQWKLDIKLRRAAGKNAKLGSGQKESERSKGGAPRVYAPLFPKIKEEGWWLVVGEPQTQELFALKRASFAGFLSTSLTFIIPIDCEKVCFYLVSDAYLGMVSGPGPSAPDVISHGCSLW